MANVSSLLYDLALASFRSGRIGAHHTVLVFTTQDHSFDMSTVFIITQLNVLLARILFCHSSR